MEKFKQSQEVPQASGRDLEREQQEQQEQQEQGAEKLSDLKPESVGGEGNSIEEPGIGSKVEKEKIQEEITQLEGNLGELKKSLADVESLELEDDPDKGYERYCEKIDAIEESSKRVNSVTKKLTLALALVASVSIAGFGVMQHNMEIAFDVADMTAGDNFAALADHAKTMANYSMGALFTVPPILFAVNKIRGFVQRKKASKEAQSSYI